MDGMYSAGQGMQDLFLPQIKTNILANFSPMFYTKKSKLAIKTRTLPLVLSQRAQHPIQNLSHITLFPKPVPILAPITHLNLVLYQQCGLRHNCFFFILLRVPAQFFILSLNPRSPLVGLSCFRFVDQSTTYILNLHHIIGESALWVEDVVIVIQYKYEKYKIKIKKG